MVAVVFSKLFFFQIRRPQGDNRLGKAFLGAALNAKPREARSSLQASKALLVLSTSILWVQRGGSPEPRPAFQQRLEKELKSYSDGVGLQLLHLIPAALGEAWSTLGSVLCFISVCFGCLEARWLVRGPSVCILATMAATEAPPNPARSPQGAPT